MLPPCWPSASPSVPPSSTSEMFHATCKTQSPRSTKMPARCPNKPPHRKRLHDAKFCHQTWAMCWHQGGQVAGTKHVIKLLPPSGTHIAGSTRVQTCRRNRVGCAQVETLPVDLACRPRQQGPCTCTPCRAGKTRRDRSKATRMDVNLGCPDLLPARPMICTRSCSPPTRRCAPQSINRAFSADPPRRRTRRDRSQATQPDVHPGSWVPRPVPGPTHTMPLSRHACDQVVSMAKLVTRVAKLVIKLLAPSTVARLATPCCHQAPVTRL